MSDLLAEVDEIMRRERVEKFFKENGKLLLAFVLGTILLTGLISGYRSWNAAANAAGTDTLLTSLDSPDFPDNILAAATLDMRPGLRGIAWLTAAGVLLEDGKTEEAAALYGRAADDTALPGDLRDLAVLMQVRLDAGESKNLQEKLAQIWQNKKSPWQSHARLEAASLYANKDKNYDKALEHLGAVQNAQGLPETLYETARALAHVYQLRKNTAEGQKK